MIFSLPALADERITFPRDKQYLPAEFFSARGEVHAHIPLFIKAAGHNRFIGQGPVTPVLKGVFRGPTFAIIRGERRVSPPVSQQRLGKEEILRGVFIRSRYMERFDPALEKMQYKSRTRGESPEPRWS